MAAYSENPYEQNYATGGGQSRGGFLGGDSSQDGAGRRSGTNSLRPVTVRQVLNAVQPHSDAPFTFDGTELSQVTMVAWIRSITRNATNVSLTLDDGTGQMDVRQWIDSSLDEGAHTDEFRENQFVRVLGEIKSFNSKRTVTAGAITVLTDHNEYLYHQLDVIYTHLELTKGKLATATASEPGTVHEASVYDDTSAHMVDSAAADLSQLKPLQRRIYQAIAADQPDWPDGVDVEQVKQRCRNIDPDEFKEALDELTGDGFIYPTSDDSHFLTTAG